MTKKKEAKKRIKKAEGQLFQDPPKRKRHGGITIVLTEEEFGYLNIRDYQELWEILGRINRCKTDPTYRKQIEEEKEGESSARIARRIGRIPSSNPNWNLPQPQGSGTGGAAAVATGIEI